MPGYDLPIKDLIARVGFEDARELWSLSKQGVDYVRSHAREELIPGIAFSEGVLEVSNVDVGDRLISELQMLTEDFETEGEGWQVDRVRDHLKTDRYFHGAYFPRSFQIDGSKYAHGLAAMARRAGARIFEDTPVVSIDGSGIRKRIVTPSARLRASHIVLAGNVHLGAPSRRLSETLLPVWRYAAVTVPLGERLAEAIAFKGSVIDTDGIDQFRVVDGDRLMWASPETTWNARPERFASAIAVVPRPRRPKPLATHRPFRNWPICGMPCTVWPTAPLHTSVISTRPSGGKIVLILRAIAAAKRAGRASQVVSGLAHIKRSPSTTRN